MLKAVLLDRTIVNYTIYFLISKNSGLWFKVGFSFLTNASGKLFTKAMPTLKDVAANSDVTSQHWSIVFEELSIDPKP